MLQGIRLENFRCFKDLEVSGFGTINLIVGRNNTGKSCFLDALGILTHPNLQSLLTTAHRRSPPIDGQAVEWDNLLSLLRRESTEESGLSRRTRIVSPDGDSFELSLEPNPQALLGRSPFLLHCQNHLGQQWTFSENDSGHAKLEPGSAGYTGATTPYVGWDSRAIQTMAQHWDQLVTLGRESLVVEWLQVLDPELRKIQFTKSAYEGKRQGIYLFRSNRTAPESLADQGDGLRRVLQIAIATQCAEKVLLIDELELGVHFSALNQIWKTLLTIARHQNLQLFLTTHSLDCLQALARVARDSDLNLVRAYRFRESGRHVVSYSGSDLLHAIKSESEVR